MIMSARDARGPEEHESSLAAQFSLHVLGNRHRLQRARVALLARPDAGFRALGRDLARGVAEDVADGEGTAAKSRDAAFDRQCLAGLRGTAEGTFGGDQRRAL